MAQDALELLKIVGWQDAHLIGHSMGGMIAMELALAAPEAVRSLALVATCAQVRAQIPLRWAAFQEKLSNEFYNGLFIPALVGIASGTVSNAWMFVQSVVQRDDSSALQRKMQRNMQLMHGSGVHANRTRYEEVYSTKLSQKLKFGWNGFRSLAGKLGQASALLTHHTSDARLLELKQHAQKRSIPILVLAGAEDRLIWSNNTLRLATLLGANSVVWDAAGHGLHYDKRSALTQALQHHIGVQ
jgi:pimeloyl-ACP methyl ester carboxylesterase